MFLYFQVFRLRCGECPGKRDRSAHSLGQSGHQETCPLDRPGGNLPVRLSVRAANDIHLQASAGSKDLHTRPRTEPVQPPLPPSEGLPDSLRLCRSEWAARGQGLVCVNDM